MLRCCIQYLTHQLIYFAWQVLSLLGIYLYSTIQDYYEDNDLSRGKTNKQSDILGEY